MIKKNLKILVITSIVTVLPMLVGIILWNKLPDQIPVHWNAAGEIDGWSSKPFAVFGIPLMMVAFQWICGLALSADPKRSNHGPKLVQLSLWIIPVISIILSAITYAAAMGNGIKVEFILPLSMGLLFAILGNYLPKCKQNYTVGIKLPWTLNSEENWNKTHRLAGWVWMIGGIAIILLGFLGGALTVWILMGITAVMALVPVVYSYVLYKKGI